MLSVSLGYVAQLVQMMAKFLELPLRYPVNPMGSRSSMFDLVTDKLSDKEREYVFGCIWLISLLLKLLFYCHECQPKSESHIPHYQYQYRYNS